MINNIIAHRGLHDYIVPENSLTAFKNAIRKDVPIEIDIHILKDGTIVVFHDDNLKRMTGIDKAIKDCTYEEIKKLRLKDTKEKIPTLKEVLDLIDGKVNLLIEYKSDITDHSLEKESFKILEDYKGKVSLQTFNIKIFLYLKKHSNYKVGLLIGNVDKKTKSKIARFVYKNVNYNILFKPDFISCDYHVINQNNIKKYKKDIYVWTIKNMEDYNKFKDVCKCQIAEKII